MRGRMFGRGWRCSAQQLRAFQPHRRPSLRSLRAAERPAPTAPRSCALAARVRELGRAFPGEVGIAVRDDRHRAGLMASWNGTRFFPQQSVSKFWVAITALQRADAGQLNLDRRITVTRGRPYPVQPADRRADRPERLYDHAR